MIILAILAVLSLQLTSAKTQQIRDPSHLPDLFLFKKNSQCRDEDRKDCQQMSAFELFDTKFRRERQSGDFEDRNSSELTELFKRSAGELSQGLDDGQVQSKLRYSPTVDENFVSTTPSYGGQTTKSPSRKVERSIAVTERPAFSYQFTTTDGLGYVHVQIGKAATTPYPAHKKIPSAYHPLQIPSTKPYHPPPVISTTPYPVHKPDLNYPSEHAPPYTPAFTGPQHHPPVYQAPPVYKPPVVSTTPYPVHTEKPPTYQPSAVPLVQKTVKKTDLEEPKVATATVKSMPDLKYHSEHAPQYTPTFSGHHYHHHPPVYQAPVYKPEVLHYPVTPKPQYQPPVLVTPKPQYHQAVAATPKPQYHAPHLGPAIALAPHPVVHHDVHAASLVAQHGVHHGVHAAPVVPHHEVHAGHLPLHHAVAHNAAAVVAPVHAVAPLHHASPHAVPHAAPLVAHGLHPSVAHPHLPKPQYHPPVVVSSKPQYPPAYHAPSPAAPSYHPPPPPPAPTPKYQASLQAEYHPLVLSPKPTVLLQADSAGSNLPPLIAASGLEHQILRDKESTANLGRVLEQFKNRSVLSLLGADFKVSGPYFVVTPRPDHHPHQSSISFPQ